MSAPETIGSVCVKEEVKGTEYECACSECQKRKLYRILDFSTFGLE